MIDATLARLRAELQTMYGPRLKGLYLYGSYARTRQDVESDVDVLIVLDRVNHYADEIDRTSRVISELSLYAGVSISRVIVSEAQWNAGDTRFLSNVREDAVPV
ncbi:MAG: nucleotidyltransferase domain-containing protein [Acidobacteria bacterium]|nr:nucleotidyltransferase domain-containing protein [Acidobacteriota bacterium]